MASKTTKNKMTRETIVKAALELAANKPWDQISLPDIATHLNITLPDLFVWIDDKEDILKAYGKQIDRKVLDNMPKSVEGEPAKDILFDIIMERFDLLSQDREALLSILISFKSDPKQFLISGPYLCQSMTLMAEAAGIETKGWRGAAKITCITGVYLNVLRVWMKDESADMAKTMAVLDKSLTQLDDVMGWLTTKSSTNTEGTKKDASA